MNETDLRAKLNPHIDGGKAGVDKLRAQVPGLTLPRIRDALLDVGEILEENLNDRYYVASIPVPKQRKKTAVIAATLEGETLLAYSCAKKTQWSTAALDLLHDALRGVLPAPKKKHGFTKRLLFLALLCAFALAAFNTTALPSIVEGAQEETAFYNQAVRDFNSLVDPYNERASQVSVANVKGLVTEAIKLDEQSTAAASVALSLLGGNNEEKIVKDTETVKEMKASLEDGIQVMANIDNPSRDWVASKLRSVDSISSIEDVTEGNDPNQMLGKEGGYSCCLYFTIRSIGNDVVKGSLPVDKGVDGGGAIEVYPTLQDAQARCDYLSGFDGTILYSGSYAIVGTMVVRTSCLLSDDAQYELTNEIVTAFCGK